MFQLSLRCVVLAIMVSSVMIPMLAHASEPSSLDVREYERLFGNLKSDLERQVSAGQIYPETIERNRKKIEKVIGYIRRSGADATPFQQKLDAYIADAQSRAGASQQSNQQGRISKDVPSIQPMMGVEPIEVMAPSWCGTFDRELGDDKGNASDIKIPTRASQITLPSLQEAAKFSCGLKDYKPVQGWTAAYRQAVSNLLGLTAVDNEALLVFASSQYTKPKRLTYAEETALKNHPPMTLCGTFPPAHEGLLEQKISRNLERQVLLCGANSGDVDFETKSLALTFGEDRYPFWLVDVEGGASTELAKLGLVYRLLTSHRVREEELYDPAHAANPSRVIENYSLARTVERDGDKLQTEIEALNVSEAFKWVLKLRVWGAERAFAIVDAFATSAASTNPALQSVFFDGPERGLDTYRKESRLSSSTLESVLAIEDRYTGVPGGMEGCGERFHKELTSWLQPQLKEGKLNDPSDLYFTDHRGSLLLYGVISCGRNDSLAPVMSEVFEDAYFNRTSIQRGPLSAAYQGMLEAYGEWKADPPPASFSSRRGTTSTAVELEPIFWNPVAPPAFGLNVTKYAMLTEVRGVVASVTPSKGGRVRVVFKTESYSSPIRECVESGRIDRIDDNGRLVPHYNCRTTGYETLTRTNDPVEMPAWVAKGLAPGQLLVYRGARLRDGTLRAWPLATYRDKSGTSLVSMLGVSVR